MASGVLVIIGFAAEYIASQPIISPISIGFLLLGDFALLVGVAALAVSLIGSAIGLWRQRSWLSKMVAGLLGVLSIPCVLCDLFLILVYVDVIHI